MYVDNNVQHTRDFRSLNSENMVLIAVTAIFLQIPNYFFFSVKTMQLNPMLHLQP